MASRGLTAIGKKTMEAVLNYVYVAGAYVQRDITNVGAMEANISLGEVRNDTLEGKPGSCFPVVTSAGKETHWWVRNSARLEYRIVFEPKNILDGISNSLVYSVQMPQKPPASDEASTSGSN